MSPNGNTQRCVFFIYTFYHRASVQCLAIKLKTLFISTPDNIKSHLLLIACAKYLIVDSSVTLVGQRPSNVKHYSKIVEHALANISDRFYMYSYCRAQFRGIASRPSFKAAIHRSFATTTTNTTAILNSVDRYYGNRGINIRITTTSN